MAKFVDFLKSAFIPSVKAQDDIVNPQETLKVSGHCVFPFHSVSRLCALLSFEFVCDFASLINENFIE